jgi:hypothetical protein
LLSGLGALDREHELVLRRGQTGCSGRFIGEVQKSAQGSAEPGQRLVVS